MSQHDEGPGPGGAAASTEPVRHRCTECGRAFFALAFASLFDSFVAVCAGCDADFQAYLRRSKANDDAKVR